MRSRCARRRWPDSVDGHSAAFPPQANLLSRRSTTSPCLGHPLSRSSSIAGGLRARPSTPHPRYPLPESCSSSVSNESPSLGQHSRSPSPSFASRRGSRASSLSPSIATPSTPPTTVGTHGMPASHRSLHIYDATCRYCETEEEQKRHAAGLSHMCPTTCVTCILEKDNEEKARHRRGGPCERGCRYCEEEEEQRRHRAGLRHMCPTTCVTCVLEKDDQERAFHPEGTPLRRR